MSNIIVLKAARPEQGSPGFHGIKVAMIQTLADIEVCVKSTELLVPGDIGSDNFPQQRVDKLLKFLQVELPDCSHLIIDSGKFPNLTIEIENKLMPNARAQFVALGRVQQAT